MAQQQGMIDARIELPAEPASVALARQFVRDILRSPIWNDLTDVVTLLTSELVTNAIRHAYPGGAAGPVVVDALVDGHVEVTVSDSGAGMARGAVVDPRHGLGIVRSVADALDIESRPGHGTRVTAVFRP